MGGRDAGVLKEAVNLYSAEASELNFQGSLVNRITADGVFVKNSLILSKGFAAVGGVRLLDAQIGGNLDCSNGTFTNPPQKDIAESGYALSGDGINVTGCIFLGDFAASGEVRFPGAQVGGSLICIGGSFTNPAQKDVSRSGIALNAEAIDVKGYVFLRGSTAKGRYGSSARRSAVIWSAMMGPLQTHGKMALTGAAEHRASQRSGRD